MPIEVQLVTVTLRRRSAEFVRSSDNSSPGNCGACDFRFAFLFFLLRPSPPPPPRPSQQSPPPRSFLRARIKYARRREYPVPYRRRFNQRFYSLTDRPVLSTSFFNHLSHTHTHVRSIRNAHPTSCLLTFAASLTRFPGYVDLGAVLYLCTSLGHGRCSINSVTNPTLRIEATLTVSQDTRRIVKPILTSATRS